MITVETGGFFQNLQFHIAQCIRTQEKNILMQWHLPEIVEDWAPQLRFNQMARRATIFQHLFSFIWDQAQTISGSL